MCAKQSDTSSAESTITDKNNFFVVGIGSSAGGLDALEELFKNIPEDTGMAYVVVSHQHPEHVSLLPELLNHCSAIPVIEASDGMELKPNHVYVSPPAVHLGVMNMRLQFMDGPLNEMPPMLIDYFFRALANDLRERAICIVLSGTGTDGTLGLRAIKGELGMAMVQAIESARFTGMPSSAIVTSLADFILPPAAMPVQLVAYTTGLKKIRPLIKESERKEVAKPLQKIFMLLHSRTGHDFSSYKQSTTLRRIERRMAAHHITKPADYVRLLRENPQEIDILFRELLIVVTSFFRDPKAFEQLREKWLPSLLEKVSSDSTFRVWVAGCGTGEEAYSVAILLQETILKLGKSIDVQIFATDLSKDSIEFARQGCYPEGIVTDVPAELLKRYFIHEKGSFRVRENIRKMLVFAKQNVVKDPPFTKIDMLCCRNLLIYLNADLQKRLIPIFHYALNPGGILMLGSSESIGGHTDVFDPLDKKWKLFRRLDVPATYRLPEISIQPAKTELEKDQFKQIHSKIKSSSITDQLRTLMLNRLVPPTVVVNSSGDIVYIHGRTGDFLEPCTGQPKMNIHDMAREGLAPALGSAMRQAMVQDKEIIRERVRVKINGQFSLINLLVVAISSPETLRGLLLVSFLPASSNTEKVLKRKGHAESDDAVRILDLEREILYAKESLHSAVEKLEISNEELKSTNEELQSSNEELQSTNEELETSKEELQSINEEFSMVNAELEVKIEALSHANDDMQNLLENTNIATIFLDNSLCIKRYTDKVRQVIKLIPTDLGRPVGDLFFNLSYNTLDRDARTVLKTLKSYEQEVVSKDGCWYLMRIMPYRTAENLIDGVVVTFVDIGKTKTEKAEAKHEIEYLRSIFDTFHEASLVLDRELRVISANKTFYSFFQTNAGKTEGQLIYDIGGGEWDVAPLRKVLEEVVSEQHIIDNFEMEAEFPKIGRRNVFLNARKIARTSGLPEMILLSIKEKNNEAG